LKHAVPVITDAHVLQNIFYTTSVRGVACQKQLQNQNWQAARLGEHPKNFGTPYLFLQPSKLATSNLIYNFGSDSNQSVNQSEED